MAKDRLTAREVELVEYYRKEENYPHDRKAAFDLWVRFINEENCDPIHASAMIFAICTH